MKQLIVLILLKLNKKQHKLLEKNIPGCIYSLPQIASIGLTEDQLIADGIEYKKGQFSIYG